MVVPFRGFQWRTASAQFQAAVIFSAVYLFLLACLHYISAGDVTSVFFDPNYGFRRRYSLEREDEANAFIENTQFRHPYSTASTQQTLCVGIPTVSREGVRYFKTTVGSLFEGMTEVERRDIYFLPFIAHTDPSQHPAHNESWIYDISDQVLTYDLPSSDFLRIDFLEDYEVDHLKKSLYDYQYLLSACYNTTAPYTLVLEDDVLAARSWYQAVKSAVKRLEDHASLDKSLYIRLFYTDKNFGWNKESWRVYLFYSALAETVLAVALLALRGRTALRHFLTPKTLLVILSICSPLCIGLYFAAGRLTVLPLPRGLHEMNAFGCCSQALLFPRDQTPALAAYMENMSRQTKPSATDQAIEKFADREGLMRWAWTPSLFQHVGAVSGKLLDKEEVGAWGRRKAMNIWSFEFEREWG